MPLIPATKVGVGPDGADIFRPILVVTIEVDGNAVQAPAIVDSGADGTLVPFDTVAPLGVDFGKLTLGPGGKGPGGHLQTRPCKGVIRWGTTTLMTSFMVSEPGKGPDDVLLGRSDFFRLYTALFRWDVTPPFFELEPLPVISPVANLAIRPKKRKR